MSKNLQFADPDEIAIKKDDVDEEVGIGESFRFYVIRNSGCIFAVIMVIFVMVLSAITTNTQINLNNWGISQ